MKEVIQDHDAIGLCYGTRIGLFWIYASSHRLDFSILKIKKITDIIMFNNLKPQI